MKFSICIPTYEYKGKGEECLEFSLNQIAKQTFKDFEVIISDHSIDDKIENLCKRWEGLDIKYFRNEEDRGNPASNMNNAMRNASGEWLKILCQDDYLLYETSMEKINQTIDDTHMWIATAYLHTDNRRNYHTYHAPMLHPQIYVVNTIGTPSCVAFKNIKPLMELDTNLSYAFDCEHYYRFMKEYGEPKLTNDVTIANYLWENSITSGLNRETIQKENEYILRKHGFLK